MKPLNVLSRSKNHRNLAGYLLYGHITKSGTPAIQTTVRYTQVSREQVKGKLKAIKG